MHVCCGLICSCVLQAYPERLIGHMLAVRDWPHNSQYPISNVSVLYYIVLFARNVRQQLQVHVLYSRRLVSLTICWCHYKGSTFSLVTMYLVTLSVCCQSLNLQPPT